jgi:hypothetical protein
MMSLARSDACCDSLRWIWFARSTCSWTSPRSMRLVLSCSTVCSLRASWISPAIRANKTFPLACRISRWNSPSHRKKPSVSPSAAVLHSCPATPRISPALSALASTAASRAASGSRAIRISTRERTISARAGEARLQRITRRSNTFHSLNPRTSMPTCRLDRKSPNADRARTASRTTLREASTTRSTSSTSMIVPGRIAPEHTAIPTCSTTLSKALETPADAGRKTPSPPRSTVDT